MAILAALRGGGAASDFIYELTDEYSFVRTNAASCFIQWHVPEHLVDATYADLQGVHVGDSIPPHIRKMRFVDNLVIGYAVRSGNKSSVEGYFLLDLDSGEGMHGLDKEGWLQALRNKQIESSPVLIDPRKACEEKGFVQKR